MKQIVSNYSYSPITNVVTLTGVNIDADQLLLIVAPQVGRTMYNFASVTGSVVAGTDTRVTLNASTVGLTTTSPLVIYYDDQASAQAVTGTVALDPASLVALENVTVTIGSSVTVGGAVTANVPVSDISGGIADYISGTDSFVVSPLGGVTFPISGTVTANLASNYYDASNDWNLQRTAIHSETGAGEFSPIGFNNSLPISGTVTANAFGYDVPNGVAAQIPVHNYDEGFSAGIKAVPALIGNELGGFNNSNPLPVSGTVTANVPNADTFIKPSGLGGFGDTLEGYDEGLAGMCVAVHIQDTSGNVLGANKDFPISGTVTANNPSGALTTRFGSVVTANLAAITSAVTNTSRKYLLAQNISAGTVTIGIGFSPTTTQGIQLTAGGGLTFDAFCPTGAVYWLGAVTGAAFTILEG